MKVAMFPFLSWAAPLAGWLLLAGVAAGFGGPYLILVAVGLIACVLEAVHHAEVVAARVGEPYGTLILAVAITVIEVALIVVLMLAGGPATSALARDTVFAAVMIILNGIVGLCLLLGATRHHEQAFGLYGTNAALTTLAAIAVLTNDPAQLHRDYPGPVLQRRAARLHLGRVPRALRHVRADADGAPRLLPPRGCAG
jgi:Ca2+:H+ antiporter